MAGSVSRAGLSKTEAARRCTAARTRKRPLGKHSVRVRSAGGPRDEDGADANAVGDYHASPAALNGTLRLGVLIDERQTDPPFRRERKSSPMFRTLLKSKIHRVAVTDCELHYEGSCAIDEDLLDAANLAENEQVHIWNINNGERFVTYAIRGERGTGIISVNGSAARRASVGDLIIIAAFGLVPEDQVAGYKPKLVFVDGANRIKEERAHVPVQAASCETIAA